MLFVTMVTIKIKLKRFGKKIIKHFYGSLSLKSEKVQSRENLCMKTISRESLHSVL